MSPLKIKFICLLIILFIPIHLFSLDFSESTFSRIDQWIEANRIEGRIPGMALAITRNGESVYTNFSGVSNPEAHPVDGKTQFFIGSLTKAFTALAIVQLAESGKVDLDDPIGEYLPDRVGEEVKRLTSRQLLSHSGGIGTKEGMRFDQSLDNLNFSDWDIYPLLESESSMIGRFQYSNMNYNLLGLVIEEVSGLEYESYINRHIIEPLGMSRTTASPENASDLSRGYRLWFNRPMYLSIRQYENYLPAMGYISCIDDLILFSDFLINCYERETFVGKNMFQPIVESSFCGIDGMFSLGWQTGKIEGYSIKLIQGGTQGSHNYIYLLPDKGVEIILLTNMNSIFQTDHTKELIPGIIGILNGEIPDSIEPGNMSEIIYIVLSFLLIISIILLKKGPFLLHIIYTSFVLALMFLILPDIWSVSLSAMRMVRLDLFVLMVLEAISVVLILIIHGYGLFKIRGLKNLLESLRKHLYRKAYDLPQTSGNIE